eukprot:scpid89441/ scgid4021/ 
MGPSMGRCLCSKTCDALTMWNSHTTPAHANCQTSAAIVEVQVQCVTLSSWLSSRLSCQFVPLARSQLLHVTRGSRMDLLTAAMSSLSFPPLTCMCIVFVACLSKSVIVEVCVHARGCMCVCVC